MSIFAGLALLAGIQSAGDIEEAVRRLRGFDLEERQSGDLCLASIAPALVDALLQLDPARRKAEAPTLARIEGALREGMSPLLPPDHEHLPPGPVTDEDQEVREQFRRHRIGMARRETTMGAVLDDLRLQTGLNIHLGIPDGERLRVVVDEAPASAERFLTRLLSPQGWTFDVRDGVVQILTIQEARRQVRLVLYDVQDITYSMDGFTGGLTLSLAPTALPDERPLYTGEDLAALAKAATPSDAWEEADGLSIQFQNGLLIVRNTREVHARISRFLLHLRVVRERKRQGHDGFYADLDRAERRVKELIDGLFLARCALERERDAEDLELRLRARQLLRAMEAELALPGLRRLLESR